MKKLLALAIITGLAAVIVMAQAPESLEIAQASEARTELQSDADFFGPQPVKAPWVVDWGASVSPSVVAARARELAWSSSWRKTAFMR